MSIRIVIPVEDEGGKTAMLSAHFGRASFFAVIEADEDGKIEAIDTIPNRGQHTGGKGLPAQHILELRPNIVISTGMGRRAIDFFRQNGIGVLQAPLGTVETVMELAGNKALPKLIESCGHAKH
ncbi:MAG: NifB/NifX family molybdenum-iron cluster-binding protein [Candidatus Hodarchaeota archaeon]